MVEWDGLENRCTGNRTVGSNPTLSANYLYRLTDVSIASVPGESLLAGLKPDMAISNGLLQRQTSRMDQLRGSGPV